jgi:hypothetical protein
MVTICLKIVSTRKNQFFQIPTVSAQAREEGFVPEPSKENLLQSSQVAIEIR